VFGPLDMHDTSFFVPEEKLPRLVDMFLPSTDAKSYRKKFKPMGMLKYCAGSGGLFSTSQDYLKFCQMLANSGTSPSGMRVISPHTLEWMTSNRKYDLSLI
jgi:CubicO group peptidase (beta-lactamase class C family)